MTKHNFTEIEELARRKRFSAEKDELNSGYCKVWRKREALKTEYGAEILTFEEAAELLAQWPDVNIQERTEKDALVKLEVLGRVRGYHVVTHRSGGIEIEEVTGSKINNPNGGGVKFSLSESFEWLMRQPVN